MPGQEPATLVGLVLRNYQTARGFEMERPPAVRPPTTLRCAAVDERVPKHWPRDPVLTGLLDELEWDKLLAKWPGWRWDAEESMLRCPDDRPLVLTNRPRTAEAASTTSIIFRRPQLGCETCELREACFHSVRPGAAKQADLSIPSERADALRQRLALVRGKVPDAPGLEIAPVDGEPGLHAVLTPRFLPAQARKRFGEAFHGAALRVEVDMPPPEPPPRRRQRRRPPAPATDLGGAQRP